MRHDAWLKSGVCSGEMAATSAKIKAKKKLAANQRQAKAYKQKTA